MLTSRERKSERETERQKVRQKERDLRAEKSTGHESLPAEPNTMRVFVSCLTFDLCGYWQRSPLPSYKWPPISHTYECTTVHLFLHRQDPHQDRSKNVPQFMDLVKMHQFLPVIVYVYIRLRFCYLICIPNRVIL